MQLIKNKNIKMFVISIFILAIGILLVVIGNSIATPNSTVLRNQEVDNLKFENASLEYSDNISTFEVDVTNLKDSEYNLKYITIKVTDENNQEYDLIGYIGDKLKTNETRKITASIDRDLTNIVDINYYIVK